MRIGAWTGLALLVGCSGDGDTGVPPTDSDEPAATGCAADLDVDIGTGTMAYEPLEDGDSVVIVHGPQGGWHVETGALVTASAQEVSITPRIVVPSLGNLQIAGDQQPQFQALANYDPAVCSGDFWAVRAFVDDVETPPEGMNYQEFICTFEGLELEFSVDVTDLTAQVTATDTVRVIAQLDASDVLACQ